MFDHGRIETDGGGGRRRLVVGISGATGIAVGVRVLELCRRADVETHLVVTRAAELTRSHETDLASADLTALATERHRLGDVAAAIASGSFQTMGMVVAPCSARTLASISAGVGDNLLARAAEVTLKERRPLVLGLRESPLSLVTAKALVAAVEAGAIVAPLAPAFYLAPQTVDDMVGHMAARLLDHFGIDAGAPRWRGAPHKAGAVGATTPTERPADPSAEMDLRR
jgi:4-hydroxy-3-polyprenylbenzoate decarboxylase